MDRYNELRQFTLKHYIKYFFIGVLLWPFLTIFAIFMPIIGWIFIPLVPIFPFVVPFAIKRMRAKKAEKMREEAIKEDLYKKTQQTSSK